MMAINIGILLIVVCILIISVCILSYLKIIFERILNEDENKKSSHFQDAMLNYTKDLKSIALESKQTLRDYADLNQQELVQIKDCNNSAQLIINHLNLQLKRIDLILQKICDSESGTSNSLDTVKYDKVAYDDAVIAFQNVNNALYSIRKYKSIAFKLLEALYSGTNSVAESDYSDFDESSREKIRSVESKINMFNESYRKEILKALKSLGMSWDNCVRFPLKMGFNNDWDENILGESMNQGAIITRVISLGYEFPDSIIIGRTKTKVI